jgi:uncharacterized Tic20 family protein
MNHPDELHNPHVTASDGPPPMPDLRDPRPAAFDDRPPDAPLAPTNDAAPAALEQQTRQWAMFLHLSIFAGFVVPVAGLVAPIVLWQVKKDELPGIDVHGKNVANWILSKIIYAVISLILVLAIIGIPLLIALGVISIIFPIIGAIKANNGEVWKYPLSIPFFK